MGHDYTGDTIHRGGRHRVLYRRISKHNLLMQLPVRRRGTQENLLYQSELLSTILLRRSEWGDWTLFGTAIVLRTAPYNATGNPNVSLW